MGRKSTQTQTLSRLRHGGLESESDTFAAALDESMSAPPLALEDADASLESMAPPASPHKGYLGHVFAAALPVVLFVTFLTLASLRANQTIPQAKIITTPQPGHGLPPPGWQAPPVESVDDQNTDVVKILKSQLSEVVKRLDEQCPRSASPRASNAMTLLAKALSNGSSKQPFGGHVNLVGVREVGAGEVREGSLDLELVSFFEEGMESLLLTVREVESDQLLTMRVKILPSGSESRRVLFKPPTPRHVADFNKSIQNVLQVCGGTPTEHAALLKGIAAPQFIASIQGLPEVVRDEKIALFTTVELMERFSFDLQSLLVAEKALSTGWKALVARRALKAVLQMQHAGISHNQIISRNILFLEDGVSVLADFDASVRFGDPLGPKTTFANTATEPELMAELKLYSKTGVPPQAHPKSDLWSLGVLLYEIMMDGQLPFDLHTLEGRKDAGDFIEDLAKNANPEKLHLDMNDNVTEYSGINRRWVELILKLLEPTRARRISAEEIVKKFQDILSGVSEVETLGFEALYKLYLQDMEEGARLEHRSHSNN